MQERMGSAREDVWAAGFGMLLAFHGALAHACFVFHTREVILALWGMHALSNTRVCVWGGGMHHHCDTSHAMVLTMNTEWSCPFLHPRGAFANPVTVHVLLNAFLCGHRFCGEECYTQAWKQGGHRQECAQM